MRYKEITEIKKIVAAWHSSHIEVYAAYRGIIDNALKGGDNQLFEDIFSMLQSFVPDDMIRGVEVFFKMVDREISKEGEVKDCQDDPISIMEEFRPVRLKMPISLPSYSLFSAQSSILPFLRSSLLR